MIRRVVATFSTFAVVVCCQAASEGPGVSGVTSLGVPMSGSEASANAAALASADPSTGEARAYIAFELPQARGAVQPQLGLSYNSSGGDREAGLGWGLSLPNISRKNLSGPPSYDDPLTGQPLDPRRQDRFVFMGQPLVPVCFILNVAAGSACPAAPGERFPDYALLGGWHYFRLQTDSTFARFFWSPDHRTWRVQLKSGETMELGVPIVRPLGRATGELPDPAGDAQQGVDLDLTIPHTVPQIYRWHITRQYDAQGGVDPTNIIVYRWQRDWQHPGDWLDSRHSANGLSYLTDVYYTNLVTAPRPTYDDFAHHVKLVWSAAGRPDGAAAVWHTTPEFVLKGVDVSSRRFAGGGARELIRRYHLTHRSASNHSLLESVQVEGRCPVPTPETAGDFFFRTSCPRLPATTFRYSEATVGTPPWTQMDGHALFGAAWRETVIADINSDGLPDLIRPSSAPNKPQTLSLNSSGSDPDSFLTDACKKGAGDCTWGMYIVPPAIGADESTVLEKLQHVSVFGNWLGDGRVNLLWYEVPAVGFEAGPKSEYAIYSPWSLVSLTGHWVWSGNQTHKYMSGIHTWVDMDADGLLDVWGGFTMKMPDGRIELFAKGATGGFPSNDFIQPGLYADMNGDGLPDAVYTKSLFGPWWAPEGRIEYRPGSGNGAFGAPRSMRPEGPDGAVRRYALLNFAIHEVTGDGLADLIVYADFDDLSVEVYPNVGGTSFGQPIKILWPFETFGRLKSAGTPGLDRYQLLFADMNGSGVDDIVLLADEHPVFFLDLLNGQRTGLLTRIANGLGATTEITYRKTHELAMQARKLGRPWIGTTPQIVPVVTKLTSRNHMPGNQALSLRTLYTYRDPAYDGWMRQFRGFRHVRTMTFGDEDAPASFRDATFLFGACSNFDHPCPTSTNDNEPMKPLIGRPVLLEHFDGTGTYHFTDHLRYRVVDLYVGMDGRVVRSAYDEAHDTWLYDTAPFRPAEQVVDAVDAVGSEIRNPTKITLRSRSGRAHLHTERVVDRWGNEVHFADFGRLDRDGTPMDQPIVFNTTAEPVGTSGWLWRIKETDELPFAQTPGLPPGQVRRMSFSYDAFGNLTDMKAGLKGTLPLQRFHEDPARSVASNPPGASVDGSVVLVRRSYDSFGNLIERAGPRGQCERFAYDKPFAELRTASTAFTGGCGVGPLTIEHEFDRGLGLKTFTTAVTGARSAAHYDGFGRPVRFYAPHGSSPGVVQPFPALTIEYRTTAGGPTQKVHATLADGSGGRTDVWTYSDGFGAPVLMLKQADVTAGDGGQWVASGLPRRNGRGIVTHHFLPWFWSGDPAAYPIHTTPATPFVRSRFDAFGRQHETFNVDGTRNGRYDFHALSKDLFDSADLDPAGAHRQTPTTSEYDGHGRIIEILRRAQSAGGMTVLKTRFAYQASGEIAAVTQRTSDGPETLARWMVYDSLGRMVLNAEPNSSAGFTADPASAAAMKAWRYAYDDSSRIVGTSDARGCGQNFHYDPVGRLIAEDLSPCRSDQAEYSSPNLADGSGTEALYRYDSPESGQTTDFGPNMQFLKAQIVAVSDRGAHTRYAYDGRGQTIGVARQLVRPGPPDVDLANRYAPSWYRSAFSYDDAARLLTQTTGATVPELLAGDGTSVVQFGYSRNGLLKSIGGSYGSLVKAIERDADGRLKLLSLGDVAGTKMRLGYDGQRRLSEATALRSAPSLWTTPTGGYVPPDSATKTQQLRLSHDLFQYDTAGDLTQIRDLRNPDEWPSGAKPVSRNMQYDDLYRLTRTDYSHVSGGDAQISLPSDGEEQLAHGLMPLRALPRRLANQTFAYDWRGNLVASDDDAHARFDRSFGAATMGSPNEGPNQLRSADPGIVSRYDDAGNLVALSVERGEGCATDNQLCGHRFAYDWDEVGQLTRARRWDFQASAIELALSTPLPPSTPVADLSFAYSAGVRVLKSVSVNGGEALHSAGVFATLRLDQAPWDADAADYTRTASTESVYLSGIGRVVHAEGLPSAGESAQHVFLTLPDYRRTTSTVIDRDTSELVQHSTFQAYGSPESDYRPLRWNRYRHPFRYTGKEDDREIGLTYYGARYYNASLSRWISPDPLTLHGLGSDPNPYAFANSSPLLYSDAVGLCAGSIGAEMCPGGDPGGGGDGQGVTLVEGGTGGGGSTTGSGGSSSSGHACQGPCGPPVTRPCTSCGVSDWSQNLFTGYGAGIAEAFGNGNWDRGIAHADRDLADTWAGTVDSVIGTVQGVLTDSIAFKAIAGSANPIDEFFERIKTPEKDRNGRYTAGMIVGSIGMLFVPGPGEEQLAKGSKWLEEIGTGRGYSVLFETRIPRPEFPPSAARSVSEGRFEHNQAANKILYEAMSASEELAESVRRLYPEIEKYLVYSAGGFRGTPPPGLTWHHEAAEGLMQLVPRGQHEAGGILNYLFHGDGFGNGFSKWGKHY